MTSARAFPEGTIIYLKTGSPPMIVDSERSDDAVSVAWFTKDGLLQRADFSMKSVFIETPDLRQLRMQCANEMHAHMRNGTVEGIPVAALGEDMGPLGGNEGDGGVSQ